MEPFPALMALCAGNSPFNGEFPSQRPVTQSFDVFFDLCLNKRLSKQSRRNHAHFDVIVMLLQKYEKLFSHYCDVIMGTMASQITSLKIFNLTVYSDADQRAHESSASLAFVRGIHRDRWIPRTNAQ